MKAKHKRAIMIVAGLVSLVIAITLILRGFNDNIMFFLSPLEIKSKQLAAGEQIRIGGIVEQGSIQKIDTITIRFNVTDTHHYIPVIYQGILPDLFREKQGVVVTGSFNDDKVFFAHDILAKHDENYVPMLVEK